MPTKIEPNFVVEKSKYLSHMDEAFSPICLSISQKILFHVKACTTQNEVWTTLEILFGK